MFFPLTHLHDLFLCCCVVRSKWKGDKDKLEHGQRRTERGVRVLGFMSCEKWLKDPETYKARRLREVSNALLWKRAAILVLTLRSSCSSYSFHVSLPVQKS